MQLSNKQIKHLRGLAHDLKPVVMVGQNGLSENVIEEIRGALTFHELIKVKVSGYEGSDRQEIVEQICNEQKATHIQSIGKMVVLFKRNPNKIKIEIPKI
ncbi:conserved hypothetical protein TIGR00253 [gamma proteobacterium HTCC5015]|nr:conserved hypothetical protein TIGR00253 [gamma proteobacterium HTCC5015]